MIITHDISQIEQEDFVYILEKGKVIQNGYRSDLESVSGQFQSFIKAYNTSEEKRKPSLIPELEPDYESEAESSEDESAENSPFTGSKKFLESSTDLDIESLQEMTPNRLKGLGHLSPSMGIEMSNLSGNRVREKRQPRLYERRLRGKGINFGYVPARPHKLDIGAVIPATPKRKPVRSFESKEITLKQILSTTWPSLDIGGRFLLVAGFVAAFLHASATPVFSYALARLLTSFFEPENPASESAKWSLVVLGIAVVDAVNSYMVHYLLESAAQSWIDALRVKSLTRILDQPRAWFDENPVGAITEDIEKNAEEMRNLLGRFAGFTFVGACMMIIGVSWSFTESWELTIVGLSIAPLMYGMTRTFSWISDKWERKSNEAAEAVGGVFEETITNIRTVRTLALERYFRKKYAKATHAASKVGMRRSFLAGIGFGLSDSTILFATGTFLTPQR